jgi:hypothetical protein
MLAAAQEYVADNPYSPPGDKPKSMHQHITVNLNAIIAGGDDPLRIRAECAHQRGKRLVGEIRMNDTHQRTLELSDPLVSQFSVDHPECLIQRADGYIPVALDYGHEIVREHRLAIMREVVTDHGTDGLSLNFTRWAVHFRRDFGQQSVPIMTAFIAQIRSMLDEVAKIRGTGRLLLGARVASTPDENMSIGLDVIGWVKRGWLDYLIVAEWNSPWPGIAVEPFVEAAAGTACQVFGHMNDMVGGSWSGPPAAEVGDRGSAVNPLREGYGSYLMSSAEARGIANNIYSCASSAFSPLLPTHNLKFTGLTHNFPGGPVF